MMGRGLGPEIADLKFRFEIGMKRAEEVPLRD